MDIILEKFNEIKQIAQTCLSECDLIERPLEAKESIIKNLEVLLKQGVITKSFLYEFKIDIGIEV